ncbi:MAG: hypothetical protein ACPGMR_14635 [Pontibacterium sp.]
MDFKLIEKARATEGVQGAAVTDLQGNLRHVEGVKDETVRFLSLVTTLTGTLAQSQELGAMKRVVFAGGQDVLAMALENEKLLAVQGDTAAGKNHLSDTVTRLALEA